MVIIMDAMSPRMTLANTRAQLSYTYLRARQTSPRRAEVSGGVFFFSSRRRHTRLQGDWSSDVCSSDLLPRPAAPDPPARPAAEPPGDDPRGRGAAQGGEGRREGVRPPPGDHPLDDSGEIGRASCRERV